MKVLKIHRKNLLNMKMVVSYLNFFFFIEVRVKSKYRILNFVFQFIKKKKWHFGNTDCLLPQTPYVLCLGHSRFLHFTNPVLVKVKVIGYDECFCGISYWLSLLKDFLIYFWSKRCLAKRIRACATPLEIKPGKSNDEIYSIVFTVICATVPLI